MKHDGICRLFACALLVVASSGCRARQDSDIMAVPSAAVLANARWEQVLECQSRAVVVDVNRSVPDNRMLQVVVRDPSLYDYFDRTMPYGRTLSAAGERIYYGQTTVGVRQPRDFVNVFDYDSAGTPTARLGFEARRYGDTLVFRALDFVATRCGGSLRGNDYTECEVANYIFRSCR